MNTDIQDNQLEKILKRRNFTNFWECFDYLKLASYDEAEAIMISLDLFNGDIWGDVITVAKINVINTTVTFPSGATFTIGSLEWVSDTITTTGFELNQPLDESDFLIEVYIMTEKSNKNYKELYKAYIETKIYENIEALNNKYKVIKLKLETHLAISLFKAGFAHFQ